MNHQSSRSSYENLLTRLEGVIRLLLCMRNQEIMLYLYSMVWYENYSRGIGIVRVISGCMCSHLLIDITAGLQISLKY